MNAEGANAILALIVVLQLRIDFILQMTFLLTMNSLFVNSAANPPYGFPYGDTYSEVENGTTVDYFCENDQKMNYGGADVKVSTVQTCLMSRTQTMNAVDKDVSPITNCGNTPANAFFICDP
jgi:hypothetical protein